MNACCDRPTCGDSPRRKNYKSDFSLALRFAGSAGGWPGHDWRAVFFTAASRARSYTVGRMGGVAVNCALGADGVVRAVFDGHGLPPGRLLCELTEWIPDGLYADGTRREVSPQTLGLGVELVEGAGDGEGEPEVVISHAPWTDAPAPPAVTEGEPGQALTVDEIDDIIEKITAPG